jgi:prepilin-type N-terminal cleavage/methylation domain-containing protein
VCGFARPEIGALPAGASVLLDAGGCALHLQECRSWHRRIGSGDLIRKRAFTLIELLVVIAIIGLLISIVVPSLGAARANAKRAVCASNLRQVGVALRTYLGESNDRFPYASMMPSISGALPLDGNDPVYIADVLFGKDDSPSKVFKCPNDQGAIDRGAPDGHKSYFDTERSSYAYRFQLGGGTLADYVRRMEERPGVKVRINSTWIFQDYDNFHAPGGTPGARRYMYIDGHVTDFEIDH